MFSLSGKFVNANISESFSEEKDTNTMEEASTGKKRTFFWVHPDGRLIYSLIAVVTNIRCQMDLRVSFFKSGFLLTKMSYL